MFLQSESNNAPEAANVEIEDVVAVNTNSWLWYGVAFVRLYWVSARDVLARLCDRQA